VTANLSGFIQHDDRTLVMFPIPTAKVLELLKNSSPGLFDLSEDVGKWVWVSFREIPAPELLQILAQLGFYWSRERQARPMLTGGRLILVGRFRGLLHLAIVTAGEAGRPEPGFLSFGNARQRGENKSEDKKHKVYRNLKTLQAVFQCCENGVERGSIHL